MERHLNGSSTLRAFRDFYGGITCRKFIKSIDTTYYIRHTVTPNSLLSKASHLRL